MFLKSFLAPPLLLKGISMPMAFAPSSKQYDTKLAHHEPSSSSSSSSSMRWYLATNCPELFPPSSPCPISRLAMARAATARGPVSSSSSKIALTMLCCVLGPHFPSTSRLWVPCQNPTRLAIMICVSFPLSISRVLYSSGVMLTPFL